MSMKFSGYLAVGVSAIVGVATVVDIARADSSTSIGISASVADACEFTANTTDLAFSEYTPGQSGTLSAQGSLEVNCTIAAAGVTFSADGGGNGRNTGGNREMDNGAAGRLAYQLISSQGLFGDASADAPLIIDLVQNVNTITVDGVVLGGQNPEGGNYADTVNVTMSF